MSSLAVFLVLGGGAAFAAKNVLPKNSVGAKQIKKNAVTKAKIKKNAVTTAKIKKNAITAAKIKNGAIAGGKIQNGAVSSDKLADGAVNGSKIANGAVTGAKIDQGSTSFSQVTDKLRGTVSLPFTGGQIYPFNNESYVQPAGRTDQYVASMQVHFPASCVAPRSAQAWLLIDPENPAVPTPYDTAGQGAVQDKGTGAVTRQIDFTPYLAGFRGLSTMAPSAATAHTFAVYMLTFTCSSGSGVTAVGAGVDVIGTK
jgi:hypothetical protein